MKQTSNPLPEPADLEAPVKIPVKGSKWLLNLARHEHFLAAIILLIALSLFYSDVFFNHRTFLMENVVEGTMGQDGPYNYVDSSDVLIQLSPVRDNSAIADTIEPYSRYIPTMLKNGELPLWNGSSGLGQPLMADGNSGAVEPIRMLFYFVPEQWWALSIDIEVLLRFFIAGFFTYLFVRTINLGFFPGIFSGISFMLCTYLVQYGNHPQLKAESLVPLLLLSFEYLVRKEKVVVFSLASFIVAWIIIASMPESGFLGLFMAGMWFLYRSFWIWREAGYAWQVLGRQLTNVAIAVGLGLGLAAFYILPFVENLNSSVHSHMYSNAIPAATIPMLANSIMPNSFSRYQAHFDLAVIVLGLFGVFSGKHLGKQGRTLYFFAGFSFIFYLKLFNIWPTELIGYLPVFNQILMIKYSNLMISLAFSIVAAFGLQLLLARKVRLQSIGLGMVLPVLVAATIYSLGDKTDFYAEGLLRGLIIVASVELVILLVIWLLYRLKKNIYYAALILAAIAVAEPLAWNQGLVRPQRYDSFTTPPFISYLKNDQKINRIFAVDSLLFPEIQSAYNLDDVRFNVAIASERRFLFLTQFLNPGQDIPTKVLKPGEIIDKKTAPGIIESAYGGGFSYSNIIKSWGDAMERLARFTGAEKPLYFNKFYDLLGASYLVAPKDYKNNSDRLNLPDLREFKNQLNQGGKLVTGPVTSGNTNRDAVTTRSGETLTGSVLVPSGQNTLNFGIVSGCSTSSPVYRVSLVDGSGEQVLFTSERNAISTCGWQDIKLDLARWSGQKVILTFAVEGPGTEPGYWSDLNISFETLINPWVNQPTGNGQNQTPNHFELVYDKEVAIYRNNYAYPRAFVVPKVEAVGGVDAGITAMTRATFDPSREAVVEGAVPDWAKELTAGSATTSSSLPKILNKTASKFEVEVDLASPGLLVVANSYNTGWKAEIDGSSSEVVPVDVALQGVFVKAGKHTIKLEYAPTSFKLGGIASLVCLAILAGAPLFGWFRRRRQAGIRLSGKKQG